MPSPRVETSLIACPEGRIISQGIVVETTQLLRDLEILTFLFHRVGIDTLLRSEVNDVTLERVALSGVTVNYLIGTFHATVILVDTTAIVGVCDNRLRHVVLHHRLLHTLLLGNEVEIVVLSQH